jgi:hypothetical protein
VPFMPAAMRAARWAPLLAAFLTLDPRDCTSWFCLATAPTAMSPKKPAPGAEESLCGSQSRVVRPIKPCRPGCKQLVLVLCSKSGQTRPFLIRPQAWAAQGSQVSRDLRGSQVESVRNLNTKRKTVAWEEGV